MTKNRKRVLLYYYYEEIPQSWTYAKMTEQEQKALYDLVKWLADCGALDQMHTEKEINWLLNACYHAYLIGIGYDSPNWRE